MLFALYVFLMLFIALRESGNIAVFGKLIFILMFLIAIASPTSPSDHLGSLRKLLLDISRSLSFLD